MLAMEIVHHVAEQLQTAYPVPLIDFYEVINAKHHAQKEHK